MPLFLDGDDVRREVHGRMVGDSEAPTQGG
jgi:hypothetical protein